MLKRIAWNRGLKSDVPSPRKGKSLIAIFGIEKAAEIKRKEDANPVVLLGIKEKQI